MVSTEAEIRSLTHGEISNPHQFLGIHPFEEGKKIIRLWRPGAREVHLEVFGKIVTAYQAHRSGLFQFTLPDTANSLDYRIYHQNGLLTHDPYAMASTFAEVDARLFNMGVHYKIYDMMGARLCTHQGEKGVKFSVFAPHAKSVALVGEFNYWDGRVNPMRSIGSTGVWELFIPGLSANEKYKYEIRTREGTLRVKGDPYATSGELRPGTASVVADLNKHQWQDKAWMEKRRAQKGVAAPMNVYEVHLGSWKRKEGHFLNYREIAHKLVDYCKKMHFTHVELLPVNEHPLDESWGYQVTGFYAVTSRFGSPEDFQYFVDHLHQNNVGVIIDWVPAHFPVDDFALSRFDGTCLYEHEDPRKGFHPHWNTHIFNYGSREVANFLIGSALQWLDKMHVDGIRVDAVASMLYLDYGRKAGEWIPNHEGGNLNFEAIEFLKHFNSVVHDRFPGVLTFAEESSAYPGVTTSLSDGGLGFDYKWNMGWMNDTLVYFSKDPIFRIHHHNQLTLSMTYAFSERYILVLSHDEVVHEKASLFSKMPGDDWQKFANLRLLLSFMICQPGKKLLFMGGELAQSQEWNCGEELLWKLLDDEKHQRFHHFVEKLNRYYHLCPALWEKDADKSGFEWVDFSDRKNSVICYQRKGIASVALCVHNFTPVYHQEYMIPLRGAAHVKEVFNTDSTEFGGSGKINKTCHLVKDQVGHAIGFSIQLAPLATMIFEVQFES